MTIKELRNHIAYIPEDCEVNICSSSVDPEVNYEIDEIKFDTVDQVFIEISEISLYVNTINFLLQIGGKKYE